MGGDGHLAVCCVVTWRFHFSICKDSAWKNAMGAIANKLENFHGSHGKKATMAKSDMGKCHGKKSMNPVKGILIWPHGAS